MLIQRSCIKFGFLCLCFLLAAKISLGQNPVISGIVKDQNTNKPVSGASISAQRNGVAVSTVLSDSVGKFIFYQLPVGTFDFVAVAPGYELQNIGPREIKTGQPLSLVVDLKTGTTTSAISPAKGKKTVIIGTVQDSLFSPLAAVNVVGGGRKSASTSTDAKGKFILEAESGTELTFSLVGFKNHAVTVRQDTSLVVTLYRSQNQIDEVVVTGYGKKVRKEALVGSVTTITPKDLKIPSSNLTTALAGRLAGVIGYQRSGEPGADNAQFFIRGVTTFGVSNIPLILIDNIELTPTDLARLQPDDIASFSVLKDASATALYGSRGANGVILVTTKTGKVGTPVLNARLESSLSRPTRMVKVADPITYMKLYGEAERTRGDLDLKYSPNKIDNTVSGINPFVYPATDWQKLMFEDQAINTRFNMDVSGGGEVAQYYVSGTYNTDNGILKVPALNNFNNNIKLISYGLRSNVSVNITPTTRLDMRISGNFDNYNGPIFSGADLFELSLRTSPAAYPAFYAPDAANQFTKHILFGNLNTGEFANPYAEMVKGYKESASSRISAQFELNEDLRYITPGLKFRGFATVNRSSSYSTPRQYRPFYYNIADYDLYTGEYQLRLLNNVTGPNAPREFLDFTAGGKDVTSYIYGLGSLSYDKKFNDKHSLSGTILGTIQENAKPNGETLQLSLPSRNIGLSGTATYGYDRRYYVEFNFGYNGSERFYKEKRFGFFPVIGASWVISNEHFWKSKFFSNLKLRGTYGKAGNDAIGRAEDRFFYLSSVNLQDGGRGNIFGYGLGNSYITQGVSISAYGNNDITWEVSRDMNVALEVGIKNSFNLTAEYYRRNRSNILMTRTSIPKTVGLASDTYANVGEALTYGTDITADYSKNIGNDLSLTLRGNFTFSKSEFVKYEEPEYRNAPYRTHIGRSLGQEWGYIAERLFIDEQDVVNSPVQSFGQYGPGDLKYADVNGDGVITESDLVPIGLPTTPEIIYGFGFTVSYKQFDFGAFFQGSSRSSFWIDPKATSPFANTFDNPTDQRKWPGIVGENALLQDYAENHWSEENKDIYALWPRLSVNAMGNNIQRSTWFMRNGAFLRWKSAELGYNATSSLAKKIGMKGLRLYLSGTNLLLLSNFKMWDIEMGGVGLKYPLQRVFNFGARITF